MTWKKVAEAVYNLGYLSAICILIVAFLNGALDANVNFWDMLRGSIIAWVVYEGADVVDFVWDKLVGKEQTK